MYKPGDLLVCRTTTQFRPAYGEILIFLGWLVHDSNLPNEGLEKSENYALSETPTRSMLIYTRSGLDWAPVNQGWMFELLCSVDAAE